MHSSCGDLAAKRWRAHYKELRDAGKQARPFTLADLSPWSARAVQGPSET
jgi:hypothetical protein